MGRCFWTSSPLSPSQTCRVAESQRQSEKIPPAAILEGGTSNRMNPHIVKHPAHPGVLNDMVDRSIPTFHTNCSFNFSALNVS